MRSGRLVVCVVLVMAGLFVGSASSAELGTSDFSIAVTAHQPGPDVENPGPVLTEPPVIGEEIWFVHDVTNHGPDRATVTLDIDATAWPEDFSYVARNADHWTRPINTTGSWLAGTSRDCDDFVMRCEFTLDPGRTYRVVKMGIANAPGNFTISTRISTPSTDLVSSNNEASWSSQILCSIAGTAGDDTLIGTPGQDSLCGFGGNDVIVADTNEDKVFGGGGNDHVSGRGRHHLYVGGPGKDTLDFAGFPVAVAVDLDSGESDVAAQVIGIEVLIGSRWPDYLEGSSRDERIVGGRGNDLITGNKGRDRLFGGQGNDAFKAREGIRDIVDGGPGTDRAFVDRFDQLASARRTERAPFADE